MSKDWRLEQLETQRNLRGVAFRLKPYRAFSTTWDHDHCVACWAKFAEVASSDPEALNEGHATTAAYEHGEDYEWCCASCFQLFRVEMGWTDETPSPPLN